MKQDDFDIPEVFRRAMEEAGWRAEQDDEGGRRPPKGRPTVMPPRSSRSNRFLILVFLVLLFIFSLGSLASFYTDILWFDSLGFRDMFVRRVTASAIVFAGAFVVAMIILGTNWMIALRRSSSPAADGVAGRGTRSLRTIIIGAGLVLAILFASAVAGQWDEFLLYLNAQQFGLQDPIFGKDIAFYLFQLPLYNLLQGWLLTILTIAFIGLLPIYAAPNLDQIQRGARQLFQGSSLRQHAAVLGGIFLLVWAGGYLLDIYGLLNSTRGVAYGASYTDMRAVLWALRLQLGFMVITSLALFYFAVRPNPRLPLIAGGLWLISTVVVGGALPTILQRYVVEPNELTLETPYIENNIALTRFAFGLDRVEIREFGEVSDLQPADLLENEQVLSNIRLWDWRPLQQTYRQLQGLRPYYEFNDVDIDRYEIEGQPRQVMLGTRELDKSKLPAPSWVNRNLEFTHGYGIVMNPVNEVTADGQPRFFIQDFPPQSAISIEVSQPEIYYGELTDDTVYVSSSREEFSYPSGNENIYTHYAGTGGIILDTFLKRLAFAARQSDLNVLLNDDITETTRVQFRRQIQDRIQALTPFLLLDADPYLVVNDEGRLIWMQDAYTASDNFPYAAPAELIVRSSENQNGTSEPTTQTRHLINYMRNSVKITVDAYDGNVTYYLSDENDPIVRTYVRIFPGVFRSMAEMPDDLLSHVRYPEDLFSVQAEQFITYHMTDVRAFYNKEDLWQIPTEISNNEEEQMEPYYVILPLPGSEEQEYLLILPFSPSTKNNMIAWMAARNDPENYGHLIVYELPKQELIFGPIQVEGRIDQEPQISEQFTLWDQRGSGVIRGNLLVLPLNQSFLYIEPVYLRSETSALPELKRIVTASNSSVAMAETLRLSLISLSAGSLVAETGSTTDETSPATEPAVPVAPGSLDELVASANAHLEAAESAQRAGDWARYGQELESLRGVLDQLAALVADNE